MLSADFQPSQPPLAQLVSGNGGEAPSGGRLITMLTHELRRTGGRYGLATMCIGVGQGIATVVERLDG